jgi:hypothetical protein
MARRIHLQATMSYISANLKEKRNFGFVFLPEPDDEALYVYPHLRISTGAPILGNDARCVIEISGENKSPLKFCTV